MKRFLLAAGIAMTSTSVFAVGTSLETDAEKFSYAFGINFTQSMMRQGAPLDADAVYMAVKDALSGSDPRLSAEAMDTALRSAAFRMVSPQPQVVHTAAYGCCGAFGATFSDCSDCSVNRRQHCCRTDSQVLL